MSGSRKTRTVGFVKLVEILKLVELVKTWSIEDKLCKTIMLDLVKEVSPVILQTTLKMFIFV